MQTGTASVSLEACISVTPCNELFHTTMDQEHGLYFLKHLRLFLTSIQWLFPMLAYYQLVMLKAYGISHLVYIMIDPLGNAYEIWLILSRSLVELGPWVSLSPIPWCRHLNPFWESCISRFCLFMYYSLSIWGIQVSRCGHYFLENFAIYIQHWVNFSAPH